MSETKWLKKETVETYARRHLQIEQLEKDEKEERERIIKLMKKGYECPPGVPYKLVLTNQERHPIAWKKEWTALARRLLKKTWRKEFKQIQDSADTVNTPMLLVKPAIEKAEQGVLPFKKRKVA